MSGIISDAQDLVKQQVGLLKHEVRTDLRKTMEAGQLLGAGLCVSAVGILLLGMMLCYLLQWAVPALPLWACYGLCGLALSAVGVCLFVAAKVKFDSFTVMPNESVQALKENVQWIQKQK